MNYVVYLSTSNDLITRKVKKEFKSRIASWTIIFLWFVTEKPLLEWFLIDAPRVHNSIVQARDIIGVYKDFLWNCGFLVFEEKFKRVGLYQLCLELEWLIKVFEIKKQLLWKHYQVRKVKALKLIELFKFIFTTGVWISYTFAIFETNWQRGLSSFPKIWLTF